MIERGNVWTRANTLTASMGNCNVTLFLIALNAMLVPGDELNTVGCGR